MDEYLEILDENGNKTGKKDTRENIHRQGLLHSEVAAFLYTNTGKILLQKRNSNKKTYSGIWSVTGGHVLFGETNQEAIVREIKEEINLNIKKEDVIYITTYKSKKIKDSVVNNKFFSIYMVKIKDEDLSSIQIQKDELEDVKLFSIYEINEVLKSKDPNYKFPQNTEVAIEYIENNIGIN